MTNKDNKSKLEKRTFPKENIGKNLTYLRILNGKNKILSKAYNGKSTFLGEVNGLFYFFNSSLMYYKNLFRTPKLREDHDECLGEIEEILNNVNLSTIEDEKQISYFEKAFEENVKKSQNPAPAPWIRSAYISGALGTANKIQKYKGLKGNMNVFEEMENIRNLYSKPLKKFSRTRRIQCLTLNSLPLIFSGGLYYFGEENKLLVTGICLGITEAYALFSNKLMSNTWTPLGYRLLKEKSERMDQFIQNYYNKEKK